MTILEQAQQNIFRENHRGFPLFKSNGKSFQKFSDALLNSDHICGGEIQNMDDDFIHTNYIATNEHVLIVKKSNLNDYNDYPDSIEIIDLDAKKILTIDEKKFKESVEDVNQSYLQRYTSAYDNILTSMHHRPTG